MRKVLARTAAIFAQGSFGQRYAVIASLSLPIDLAFRLRRNQQLVDWPSVAIAILRSLFDSLILTATWQLLRSRRR